MTAGRLARWWGLPASERWLALCALVQLALVRAALPALGYLRLRRWMEALSPVANPGPATGEEFLHADRLANLVAAVGGEGITAASCLPQSLLVYLLLRRRGLSPALQLGVREGGDFVEAHAWVELDGRELGPGARQHLAMRPP